MAKCIWCKAWIGQCKLESIDGTTVCQEHTKECCSCGRPATHNCGETGLFVCDAPLCDDCEHTTFPDGTNGFYEQTPPEGMNLHCRKSEQRFRPWYAQEDALKCSDRALDLIMQPRKIEES